MRVEFLHLHKTAGTSVRLFLRSLFPVRDICPAGSHEELVVLPPDTLRGYRLLSGHYDWAALDGLPGPRFTFTVLRDPVERLVSNYFYWRQVAGRMVAAGAAPPDYLAAARELSPDAFFAGAWDPHVVSYHDHQDNLYARYFADRRFAARQETRLRAMPDADLLAAARRNLDRLDGLYASTDLHLLKRDVVSVLGRTGGWRSVRGRLYPIRAVRINTTQGNLASRVLDLKSLGATQVTFERIADMTRLDRILWTERFGRPAIAIDPGGRIVAS